MHGAVKRVCAGEKQGGAAGHRFYFVFSAVREVGFVSGGAWKFRKEKNGCDLLRQERTFKNKVEREKFLGLEGCWACLGLQKNTCPSQRERLLANPFSLWGNHSALPSVVSERAWGCGFLE